jgi:hypothetical protein
LEVLVVLVGVMAEVMAQPLQMEVEQQTRAVVLDVQHFQRVLQLLQWLLTAALE